jgi:CheY-like chemotaxis protein
MKIRSSFHECGFSIPENGGKRLATMILVVEDSDDDAKYLQLTLESLKVGNPIRTVGSAAEAVAYLEKRFPFADREKYPTPTIIFVDLRLPGTDGFAFLEWLKHQPGFDTLMVIAISGMDDMRAIRRAYDLGAKSFLPKPCRIEDVRNLIHWFPRYWILTSFSRSEPPSQ